MSTHVLSLSRPSVGFDVRRWAGWLTVAVIGGGAEFQPKVEATAVDLPMALLGTLGFPRVIRRRARAGETKGTVQAPGADIAGTPKPVDNTGHAGQ